MENKVNNIFIIAPLSKKENHFFLVNGLIPEVEISKLDSLIKNKEYIVIVTKENEFDWWAYFWNCQDEENKVQTYLQSNYKGEGFTDNEIIFRQLFNIDETFFNLVKLNNLTILLKDVSLINPIIIDISSKIEILWKNFDYYDENIHKTISDWYMTSIPFLNTIFYEKYKRVCYLILDDEQKKSDYYIINQSFRHQQLLIIEFVNDEYSSILKYRIKVIRQTQNHPYNFFAENSIEVLKDFYVYILKKYSNLEKKYDELFMINTEDLKYLSKITDSTDERFRYVWIDEVYYNHAHKSAFNLMENSLWVQKNIFGVIIRKHIYYERYSDFGSDNSVLFAFGDSNYPALRTIKPLVVYQDPRGFSKDVDYYLKEASIYKHFYQDKKLVLINFDSIPYIGRVDRRYERCIIYNIEELCAVKVIRLPKFLLEDSFILTTDYYENN